MRSQLGSVGTRVTLAINLELSHGPHGAAARIEMYEPAEGACAVVGLRGWIEEVAHQRLIDSIEGLVKDVLNDHPADQLLVPRPGGSGTQLARPVRKLVTGERGTERNGSENPVLIPSRSRRDLQRGTLLPRVAEQHGVTAQAQPQCAVPKFAHVAILC